MARPHSCRRINGMPGVRVFKPSGAPASSMEEIALRLDELEAIRLADLEGLYQQDAAREMNVSRQTFGRILAEAHGKVARAIVEGNILKIEGGEVEMVEGRKFSCTECNHTWQEPFGPGRSRQCPKCGSGNIHREHAGRGRGYGGACRRRRGAGAEGKCHMGGGRGRRGRRGGTEQ